MSTDPHYWLILFNHDTWRTFLQVGADTAGFRRRRWSSVQKIRSGDYLLCYLTGISRWIGALVVTGEPYLDATPLWPDDSLSARVPVKPVVLLAVETAVPIVELRERLSLFHGEGLHWTAKLRQSPTRWSKNDADAVMEALLDAQVNPVVREFDQRRLKRRSRHPILASLTVTDSDDQRIAVNLSGFPEPSGHTEIQWLLLKLGNDLGLDVWVARNDRGRRYAGQLFTSLPRLLAELPRQFDRDTGALIELIDVLWLQDKAIVAAFEIESTSTIYSGLLRMADLVALQPNLNIPLYIVAPDKRRDKVMREVNRPAFNRLAPPLNQICRYIAFSRLRAILREISTAIPYLKPAFLDGIAESCQLEPDK